MLADCFWSRMYYRANHTQYFLQCVVPYHSDPQLFVMDVIDTLNEQPFVWGTLVQVGFPAPCFHDIY